MRSEGDNENHRHRHLHSASESVPLRPSLERAYRSDSGSEDEFSDLDVAPAGNPQYTNRRKWPWTARFRRIISGEEPNSEHAGKARRRSPPPGRTRGWCWRRRYCLIIAGILLAGLITLLSGGAFWVYKTAPKDGVCLPPNVGNGRIDLCGSFRLLGTQHLKAVPCRLGKKATRKQERWLSA